MNLPICIWDVNLSEEKTIPFATGFTHLEQTNRTTTNFFVNYRNSFVNSYRSSIITPGFAS